MKKVKLVTLPVKLLPDNLAKRIDKKLRKLPLLNIEDDGIMVIDCNFLIKDLSSSDVCYVFSVDVFGPKMVEVAHRSEELYGMVGANTMTFVFESVMILEDWRSGKEIDYAARCVVDDCVRFYIEDVYNSFAGDANGLLDSIVKEYEESREEVEALLPSDIGITGPIGNPGLPGGIGDDIPGQSDKRVTFKEIQALMESAKINDSMINNNTTVVTMIFPNGWTMTEQSACIDPNNYDHTIGVDLCKKRIENRLWELEGYRKLSEYTKEANNGCN